MNSERKEFKKLFDSLKPISNVGNNVELYKELEKRLRLFTLAYDEETRAKCLVVSTFTLVEIAHFIDVTLSGALKNHARFVVSLVEKISEGEALSVEDEFKLKTMDIYDIIPKIRNAVGANR